MSRSDRKLPDRIQVGILGTQPAWLEDALASKYELVLLDRTLSQPKARDCLALVCGGGAAMSATALEKLPRLEFIAVNGVGIDGLDLEACARRGIWVANTPDVLTDDVADMAIALMFAVMRRVVAHDRFVREGRWVEGEKPPLAHRVTGRRIGILGLGRIGEAIAARAAPFAGEILYHNRRPKAGSGYRYVGSVIELARQSDILIASLPGGKESHRVIDAEVLAALGQQSVLVNVARGSVIDEEALVDALVAGRIAGAGLDVFVHEPNVPPQLLALDQVVLQPHQASATVETRRAMGELLIRNLADYFAGNEPPAVALRGRERQNSAPLP